MTNVRYKFVCAAVYLLSAVVLNEGIKLTATEDENVTFEQLEKYAKVTINENVESALLFYIENATKPSLDEEVKCARFAYKIFERDGKNVFKLTTPLDYEEDNCQIIENSIKESDIAFFNLFVNNLDDNFPQFHLQGSNCQLQENTKYTKDDTPCKLTMIDLDGMMDNANLSITPYGDTFNISYLELPEHDAKETTVGIYLADGVELDYETMNQYIFTVKAQEEVTNGNIQMSLEVIDMPDQPPKFVQIFASEQFDENVDQHFTVKAIDGDTGVHEEINYMIINNSCDHYTCEITIGKKDGIIFVTKVDREEVGDSITFGIKAYEVINDQYITQNVYFFIQDLDDNIPKFTKSDPWDIDDIDENYIGNIGNFEVEDMDLADNGIYTITMEHDGLVDYPAAFQVIPTQGYQKSEFTLTVKDSSKLDFDNEKEDWKIIKFDLVATEKANDSHVNRRSVIIHLIDLNDEPPIFVNDTPMIEVNETIKEGEFIFNALATDRDADDVVTYSILGIWGQKLNIDTTGIISPAKDDVFDHEQLKDVFIQIEATDKNETHKTFKTLTINVLDIDDEPPRIQTVSKETKISIKENGTAGEILKVNITASDPDDTPKLKLEIDWNASYITKNSAEVEKPDDDKWKCFELNIEEHSENSQILNGSLKTKEQCLDFELYDTMVIGLKVTDENTVKRSSYSNASIQIFIQDVNDNEPVFDKSSFENLKVTDGTNEAETIGTIIAHDPDIKDNVTFSIEPTDKNYDWVDIDGKKGTLTIKEGVTINDDIPPAQYIPFTVTASDGIHKPTEELQIWMLDINNQKPTILNTDKEISIEEELTSGTIIKLDGEDKDRDEEFHTMVFQFDNSITPEAANCFDISDDGLITISLKRGARLDRDLGQQSYTLPVLASDNPRGISHLISDTFELTVKLLDINDNAPEIKNTILECSENMKKGGTLGPIIAEDPDEEGDNSNVQFEIIDIQPTLKTDVDVLSIEDLQISSSDKKTATLEFLRDLEGLFGEYDLIIRTSDYGEPPMKTNNQMKLTVTKFNFFAPVFVFPSSSDLIILSEEQIPTLSQPLKLYDQTDLPDLEVDDLQNHKWEVKFEFTKQDEETSKLFSITNFGTWKARLRLLRRPTQDDMHKEYTITIEASVKNDRLTDEAPVSIQQQMKLTFFSTNEEPEFETNNCNVTFDEYAPEEHSSDPPQPTKTASFPSRVSLPIYYILLDNTGTFKVDETSGYLSLQKDVHFKDTPSFDIKIVASKNPTYPKAPSDKSTLNVHVKIRALNIHEPVFKPSKFNGAFLKSSNKQSTIVTVTATDEDSIDKDQLRFRLENMQCVEAVQAPSTPFEIGPLDGKITPTFTLTSTTSGYCTMDVYVTDGRDKYGSQHTVHTTVQINTITTDELVRFTFLNEDSEIHDNQELITAALDEIFKNYNYRSNLADLNYDPDWRNTTADFYFLDSQDIPVPADEILGNLTDFDEFTTLKKSLAQISVNLGNFPGAVPVDVEDYLKIWLIASTIVLATFLMLLSVAFFFRNRALTQRINKLSTTTFGSQESNLNRAGLAAPTTNRNAIEGSNPVFSSQMMDEIEVDIDTRSVNSMDSDLFGVEDNPEFDI